MKMDTKSYNDLLNNLYDGVYFADKTRKIIYWNKGAEKLTGFKSSKVIGKYCWDNIIVHLKDQTVDLCKKHCPLQKTLADGRPRKLEAYLRHKDGHMLPVLLRIIPIRDAKKRIVSGAIILADNSAKIAITQRYEECRKMALLDPLTKIANRRYINKNLQARFDEMTRYGWSFGILFIDIDRFKKVNDMYGHDVGDKVLKMVTKTVVSNLRAFDILGRWGGEEFMGIIVNIGGDRLLAVAKRLCLLIEQSSLPIKSDTVSVTVSIGVTRVQPNDTVDTLLKRVDKLMYKSKAAGRNCVSMEL